MKRDPNERTITVERPGESGSMPAFTVITKLDLVALYLEAARPKKGSR